MAARTREHVLGVSRSQAWPMAVETVLGMARGRPARVLQLATALTVRDSTGPAPAA